MFTLALVGIVAALTFRLAGRFQRALHILQLEHYANRRFLHWLFRIPGKRLFDPLFGSALLLLSVLSFLLARYSIIEEDWRMLSHLALVALLVLTDHFLREQPEAKKALVYTARAKRILCLSLLIALLIFGSVSVRHIKDGLPIGSQFYLLALALDQGAALIVMAANLLLTPIQKCIDSVYIRRAREWLACVKPTTIGVTGSYGKTTTKAIIDGIVSKKFDTLATPASFNTYLGIVRTINELLKETHQVFVVEMGAYQRGEIRKKAQLIQPSIGVVTAVGPQHLERFGSLENVERAKYELVEELPRGGVAIFNCDDPRCRKMAASTTNVRVVRYGISGGAGLDIWADEIRTDEKGSSFYILTKRGDRQRVETQLLGKHNVSNILAGVAVSLELGMNLATISDAIADLGPVPHRLQLLRGGSGVTIIDDSYNSNPQGAEEALEVLSSFSGAGKRILVTPGMIELGELQYEYNRRLGVKAAEICDYVILVGPRQTRPIAAGLSEAGFPPNHVSVVEDLDQARTVLSRIIASDDVVLFENDLPDTYTDVP